MKSSLIYPDWPAPCWVHSVSTTRQGGISAKPFSGFNLALHVGDEADDVMLNRAQLAGLASLPGQPHWLTQVHGNSVVAAGQDALPEADAAYTREAGAVCAVMTADCLPILLCHRQQRVVAAVHVGWRGLAAGVIEAVLSKFPVDKQNVMAWLGPAISTQAFEVGDDVYQALALDKRSASCFIAGDSGHWYADLYELARIRLRQTGVDAIYGSDFCTYRDAQHFFSYRRDGKTGRMASLVWMSA